MLLVYYCLFLSSVPGDCSEPVEALSYFSARFTQRYGPIHPLFYIGDLTDAVKVATGGSADEVSWWWAWSVCASS